MPNKRNDPHCALQPRDNLKGVVKKQRQKHKHKPKTKAPKQKNKELKSTAIEIKETNNDNVTIITVSSMFVARLRGKGNCKLQSLKSQSGAEIKITKDANGLEDIFRISGDEKNRNDAELLIKSLQQEEQAVFDQWATPIYKNLYSEDAEISVWPREQVAAFRLARNNITISHYKKDVDRPLPNPVTKFIQAFGHYPEILSGLQHFKEPSPIQCQAWPVILKGHDMIGIAQTGTGKKLAFLLPALIHVQGQRVSRSERGGPCVLIIVPGRQYSRLIEIELSKFPHQDIKCAYVTDGDDQDQQILSCQEGVDIVVATSQGLIDLIESKKLKIGFVSYVVISEADLLFVVPGCERQMKKILYDIRPDRQIIIMSPSWHDGIGRIVDEYVSNPLQVCVNKLDFAAVHSVTQHVQILKNKGEKLQRLVDFIESLEPSDKVIVFTYKWNAEKIATYLTQNNIACHFIHFEREQSEREQALEDFANGTVKTLIVTDAVSRGVDIKDFTHIINYEFPKNADEYLNRIDRNGRDGRKGIAISLFTPNDRAQAQLLNHILKETGQATPEKILQIAEAEKKIRT